jgi:hypothetical protein
LRRDIAAILARFREPGRPGEFFWKLGFEFNPRFTDEKARE